MKLHTSFTLILCCCTLLTFCWQQASAQVGGQKPELIMYRYNGSLNGASPITGPDTIGTIRFNALTAIGSIRTGASIRSFVTGPITATSVAANMVFRTGSVTQLNRMVITSGGLVGVNTMNPGFTFDVAGNTHTSGNFYGRIHVDDTQNTDAAPSTYNNEVYFEFKKRSVLASPGSGTYAGLMTIAPGSTNAHDKHHQLNFNNDGIFYRNGSPDAASWAGAWSKILTGADINGTLNRIAKFTDVSKLGDSQLFDDGANVGIGTVTPTQKLDVNGNARVQGNAAVSGELNVTGNAQLNGAQTVVGGNLGVGTAAPTTRLDVNGDSRLGGNTNITNNLSVGNNANIGASLLVGNNANIIGALTTGNTANVGTTLTVGNNANVNGALDVAGTAHVAGKVAIGTTSTPGTHALYVGGSMICTEAKVALTSSWPDYVFAAGYPRLTLAETEAYIAANQHLPGVASAAEVAANGLALGETERILTEKMEEAYLHLIDLEKRLQALEQANRQLQAENAALQS